MGPRRKGNHSIHSRAARRETSPSIDTDKSLKNVGPPTKATNRRPNVLSVHQGAGIVKASHRGRKSVLSAKARRRQERGLDRAEAIMDKTAIKVEKSKGRSRKVQERRRTWEDVNKKMIAEEKSRASPVSDKENQTNAENDVDMEEQTAPTVDTDVLGRVENMQIQSPRVDELTGTISSISGVDEEEIL